MQKTNKKQVAKFLTLVTLFLFLFLIFPRKLSINKYISENHFKYCGVKVLRSTFTHDSAYRLGRPEGIIVHSTDSKNSAEHDAHAFLNNWQKRQAYVHAFVDDKEILQIHTPARAVWGAGYPANRRYIHVELCETNNPRKFAQGVNNDAIYIARLLHRYNLKPSRAVATKTTWSKGKRKLALQDVKDNKAGGLGTIWSHHEVTNLLGNTTHVDPDHYFVKFGYNMQQFYDLICQYYYGRNYQPSASELLDSYIRYGAIIIIVICVAGLGWVIYSMTKNNN